MSTEPGPQRPPTTVCDDLAGPLAALALGATPEPDEQELLLAHLVICASCRRRLEAYATVAGVLPLAAPEAEPPPELRARILAAAEGARRDGQPGRTAAQGAPPERRTPTPTAEGARPGRLPAPSPARQAWPGWRRLALPALGLALACLIGLGVVQQAQIRALEGRIAQQQAQSAINVGLVLAAFGNDDAVEVELAPTGPAPDAWGRTFISPGEPAVAIYGRMLPQLPPEQTYQLWIVHDGRTISGGLFSANAEGRAWRPLRPSEPLGTIERVFVTVEPAGGSAQPTGGEYLSGAPGS